MSRTKEKMVIKTECQEGICPICGGKLEYTGYHLYIEDDGALLWKCTQCNASGREIFNRVFSGKHYNVRTADGTPVEIKAPEPVANNKRHIYRIGFNESDETEFDIEPADQATEMAELMTLFFSFLKENSDIAFRSVDYVRYVGESEAS